MKQRNIKIQKAICEIENPYPKDDLITCYKDFLLIRDSLPYYKFNLNVFQSLVDLTSASWNSKKRINRISLLESIKKYEFKRDKEKTYPLPRLSNLRIEVKTKVFLLFKYCFETPNQLRPKQINKARKICNSILINKSLEPSDEKWLCENAERSEMILNRVLRYPVKSNVISNWAKENFKNITFLNRRAELASWLLDEDPYFEIDKQVLIDDFENLNLIDANAIEEYDNELGANEIINRELIGVLPSKWGFTITNDGFNITPEHITSSPELKLTKRFYEIPVDSSKNYPVSVPDFERMSKDFYSNIDTIFKRTMLWAIAYSRLENSIKTELFKKYYSNETYNSFFKLCKKHKLLDLLKWLKDRQQ